jgi:hypothetical protein
MEHSWSDTHMGKPKSMKFCVVKINQFQGRPIAPFVYERLLFKPTKILFTPGKELQNYKNSLLNAGRQTCSGEVNKRTYSVQVFF